MSLPERIESLKRLWKLLQDMPAPDQRLTPERRHRIALMMRALDGATSGASHREIAIALYGAARIEAEHWPTSSLRFTVRRLIEDARKMVFGGYRELLRVPAPQRARRGQAADVRN